MKIIIDYGMREIGKILKLELERRRSNNRAYSLRAFAQFLKVSPATLSQIISGKRGVSVKRLNEMTEKLGLAPLEQSRALRLLRRKSKVPNKKVILKDDQFRLISEWYHYAILSLGELKNCSADPRWIAQRLNIRVEDANEALVRLQRMGIIQIKNGKYKQISDPLKTTTDIPSSSIRNYHKGLLSLAQNKIDHIPVEKREYSSVTMAIDTKNLAEAKKLTQEYKEDMAHLLEDGQPNEVYQLSIQLFPLTHKDVK